MIQPDIITVPFGENAAPETINPIPVTRDSGDDPQQATWSEGFPRVTMQPLVTGGIPPKGQDFNGILKALSEHTVFQNAGGVYRWSADVVAAGGYDKGAVVQADDGIRSYVSITDGNTQALGGSNWLLISMPIATAAQAQELTSSDTLITPQRLGDSMNSHVLGMGQTWQVVSRDLDTNYSNTTGRPIAVCARIDSGTVTSVPSIFRITGSVDGVTVAGDGEIRTVASSASSYASISFIVPPGSVYNLRAQGGVTTNDMLIVVELR